MNRRAFSLTLLVSTPIALVTGFGSYLIRIVNGYPSSPDQLPSFYRFLNQIGPTLAILVYIGFGMLYALKAVRIETSSVPTKHWKLVAGGAISGIVITGIVALGIPFAFYFDGRMNTAISESLAAGYSMSSAVFTLVVSLIAGTLLKMLSSGLLSGFGALVITVLLKTKRRSG